MFFFLIVSSVFLLKRYARKQTKRKETEIVVPALPYSALFCRVVCDLKSSRGEGEIYICKGPGRHNLQEDAYKVLGDN